MSIKVDKKIVNPLTGSLYFSKHNRLNPTENSENNLNPYYRPVPSKLSIQARIDLIWSVGEECIMPEELE